MEKPSIEKIVAKLEERDAREWTREIREPLTIEERYEEFVAEINGLTFSLYLSRKHREFRKDLFYPCLSITNKERAVGIEYNEPKTDSVEAKEIGRLHKKIKEYFTKEKQIGEFEEKLNAFLSD